MTTRNFAWHDCPTDKVKLAAHGRFDEGFSDFPLDQMPANVNHLLGSENNDHSNLTDASVTSAKDPSFHAHP